MGGCTDCGNKGGCDTRKGTQRELLDDVVARVYPERTWGRPDDEARFRAGVPRLEVKRMARSLASLLKAPTFFRGGGDEDLCDFVWVLCVGREPSLVEVRDGLARAESARIEEKYLRVCFSSLARMAAVQEVSLSLRGADEIEEAPGATEVVGQGSVLSSRGEELDAAFFDPRAALIRESPRAGVYDPILMKRMQKLVGFLEASDISHIDFGLLDKPVANAVSGDYVERYGVEPRLANFLFYSAPPTTASTTFITS